MILGLPSSFGYVAGESLDGGSGRTDAGTMGWDVSDAEVSCGRCHSCGYALVRFVVSLAARQSCF